MPRLADHDQRRREAIEALWRVIATQGIDKASVRHVAAETGWSRGIIDYYFDSMQELLVCGLRTACAVDIEAQQSLNAGSGWETLRAALMARMPISDEQQLHARVWLAYLGRAMSDAQIAREYAECQRLRGCMWAELLGEMVTRGELPPTTDVAREAALIMAFELSANANALLNPTRTSTESIARLLDEFVAVLASRAGAAVPELV